MYIYIYIHTHLHAHTHTRMHDQMCRQVLTDTTCARTRDKRDRLASSRVTCNVIINNSNISAASGFGSCAARYAFLARKTW